MGGEHIDLARIALSNGGSSPRGRGTRYVCTNMDQLARIIPAWAGNTCSSQKADCVPADHPRVGGEHQHLPAGFHPGRGSSPRGRGTLQIPLSPFLHGRIIPAWAGNTLGSSRNAPLLSDHPRVGGEHSGSSPVDTMNVGSSPRGRGTPLVILDKPVVVRIIPAWAGNTWQRCPGCFP